MTFAHTCMYVRHVCVHMISDYSPNESWNFHGFFISRITVFAIHRWYAYSNVPGISKNYTLTRDYVLHSLILFQWGPPTWGPRGPQTFYILNIESYESRAKTCSGVIDTLMFHFHKKGNQMCSKVSTEDILQESRIFTRTRRFVAMRESRSTCIALQLRPQEFFKGNRGPSWEGFKGWSPRRRSEVCSN